MKHLGGVPLSESPISKTYLIEAKQHRGTPGFVPKWIAQHGPSPTPGHYMQCIKLIKPAVVSVWNGHVSYYLL